MKNELETTGEMLSAGCGSLYTPASLRRIESLIRLAK